MLVKNILDAYDVEKNPEKPLAEPLIVEQPDGDYDSSSKDADKWVVLRFKKIKIVVDGLELLDAVENASRWFRSRIVEDEDA